MGLWQRLKGEEPGIINTLLNFKNKGQFGEYATEFALTNDNIEGYSKTLHNIYLNNNGKTTEIDVILIHVKGLFVFESKNYSGWIFGSLDQQKWTQCLYNKEKYHFYNPINQNKTHCKALSEFIQVPFDSVTSYIIFSNRCELKRVPDDTHICKIVRRVNLLKKLRKELEQREVIYTKEQVDDIYVKLQSQTNVSDATKEKHIADIKERIEGTVCPFCGGELILRNGKYGKFYGCSNYPKCKYTRKT